jgi:hypothetical protein
MTMRAACVKPVVPAKRHTRTSAIAANFSAKVQTSIYCDCAEESLNSHVCMICKSHESRDCGAVTS